MTEKMTEKKCNCNCKNGDKKCCRDRTCECCKDGCCC